MRPMTGSGSASRRWVGWARGSLGWWSGARLLGSGLLGVVLVDGAVWSAVDRLLVLVEADGPVVLVEVGVMPSA